jgi:D-3-phosphoglycerate dehydrogenase
MPKVLISDKLSQNAVNIFAAHGVGTDIKTGPSPEELQAIIGAYDGLESVLIMSISRQRQNAVWW